MESLVAVVVTYNRIEYLKVCVERLLAEKCDQIIVVDNCSTDGTREWLLKVSELYEKLDVVWAPENLGGAGGFELGFRYVMREFNPDWLVCFDDDALPYEGAFEAFLESDLDNVDAVASAVYYKNGDICDMNVPSLNPFWRPRVFMDTVLGRGRAGFHLSEKDFRSETALGVDAASFVGFFVRREVVRDVGYPEGRLFIYGDDVLYTLAISDSGWRISFLPWVRFEHDCSTYGKGSGTYDPLWKAYYTYRNVFWVYRQAAGQFFWLVLPFKALGWMLQAPRYPSPFEYLRVVVLALWDGVRGKCDRSHQEVLQLCEKNAKTPPE